MKWSDFLAPFVKFVRGTAPATPATGNLVIYAKTDGLMYCKDDAGNEYCLAGITNVADDTAKAALTPWKGQVVFQLDDSTLYKCTNVTGPVWGVVGSAVLPLTTEGDLLYQGASAPARLAKGTAKQILQMNSGATAPEWVDDPRGIVFAISGVDLATTQVLAITAPYAMTITGGKVEVGTAPTGAALICDVHKNGTTLWTTQANRPTIAAAGTSATITAPDVTSVAQGDRLELQIDQIGSTVAGKNLSLTLYGKRA